MNEEDRQRIRLSPVHIAILLCVFVCVCVHMPFIWNFTCMRLCETYPSINESPSVSQSLMAWRGWMVQWLIVSPMITLRTLRIHYIIYGHTCVRWADCALRTCYAPRRCIRACLLEEMRSYVLVTSRPRQGKRAWWNASGPESTNLQLQGAPMTHAKKRFANARRCSRRCCGITSFSYLPTLSSWYSEPSESVRTHVFRSLYNLYTRRYTSRVVREWRIKWGNFLFKCETQKSLRENIFVLYIIERKERFLPHESNFQRCK